MQPSEPLPPVTYRDVRRTFLYVVLADAFILSVALWLIARRKVPEYPVGVSIFPILFVGNLIVLWLKRPRGPVVGVRVSKLTWFAGMFVTICAAVALANLLMEPSLNNAFQALIGICMAVGAWWIIRNVKKTQSREEASKTHDDVRP
jgi:hypothetical protein